MSEQQDQPGRPGRRRSEDSRQAILTAALDLVGEVGYGALTIEGIAARAGTGKQTIYRWWPSKADVLLDALAARADLHVPVPDNGSYALDLREFLRASFTLGRGSQVADGLRALMAEALHNPAFSERFRSSFLQPRRTALGTLLARAQAKDELPPGLSPGTITDIVFGTIWYRLLATRQELDDHLVEELLTALS
jgi:AcrR family transcriptional regulator